MLNNLVIKTINISALIATAEEKVADSDKGWIISKFEDLKEGITGSIESLNENLNKIIDFFEFITDPSKIVLWLWHGVVEYSYIICFIICVVGILTWVHGSKKGAIATKVSITAFAIIRAINACL